LGVDEGVGVFVGIGVGALVGVGADVGGTCVGDGDGVGVGVGVGSGSLINKERLLLDQLTEDVFPPLVI